MATTNPKLRIYQLFHFFCFVFLGCKLEDIFFENIYLVAKISKQRKKLVKKIVDSEFRIGSVDINNKFEMKIATFFSQIHESSKIIDLSDFFLIFSLSNFIRMLL